MRTVAVVGAIVVLLWLTLPMLVSPASVAAALRDEDRLHAAWLGESAAHGIRVRALGWLDRAAYAGDNAAPMAPLRLDPLSVRLAVAGDAMSQNPSVQGTRALGRFAVYRLAALVEWFGLGFPLLLAATIDGALMRTVKLRSFAHVSPVLFGIGLHGMLAVLAGMALAMLVPVSLHPLAWGGLLVAFAATVRTAVSNFHRVC